MDWQKEEQTLRESLKSWRRYLHIHAETGFDLPKTTAFVKKVLRDEGVSFTDCGKSGIVAVIGRGERAFLLRADMDALPIREQSGEPFAAANGAMHACGHDMHTTMLLGAARLLKQHEAALGGTVKLMFQPAEEILEGARDMVGNGALQNPTVTAGMMLHVLAGIPLPVGTVILPAAGVGAPCADFFTVTVTGKGCHGSSPQNGIDPLSAAAHIVLAWQEISSREIAAEEETALTVGAFLAGNAANVIPDQAVLKGTLRAFSEEVRDYLKTRLTDIAQTVGTAFRTQVTVKFDSGCPTLQNDAALIDVAEKAARELFGDEVKNAADFKGKAGRGGSEDFAYISHKIPTVMVGLSAGKGEFPLHHPQVTFDESILVRGSALLAAVAAAYLKG